MFIKLKDKLPIHDRSLQGWTQKELTKAQVKMLILDDLYRSLPRPPFTDAETDAIAGRVYDYLWQRSASGQYFGGPASP